MRSKVNSEHYYIGTVEEIAACLKIRVVDSEGWLADLCERYPYVVYKLLEGRAFRRTNKAIKHVASNDNNSL